MYIQANTHAHIHTYVQKDSSIFHKHAYMHKRIQTCSHTRIHTYLRTQYAYVLATHMHTHIHTLPTPIYKCVKSCNMLMFARKCFHTHETRCTCTITYRLSYKHIYKHTHTYMHTYTYLYTYTHSHNHTTIPIHTSHYASTQAHKHIRTHISLNTYMHTYKHTCIPTHVCIHECVQTQYARNGSFRGSHLHTYTYFRIHLLARLPAVLPSHPPSRSTDHHSYLPIQVPAYLLIHWLTNVSTWIHTYLRLYTYTHALGVRYHGPKRSIRIEGSQGLLCISGMRPKTWQSKTSAWSWIKNACKLICGCQNKPHYASVYISQHVCAGHDCDTAEFPVLDYDEVNKQCTCRAHPCWALGVESCPTVSMSTLRYREDVADVRGEGSNTDRGGKPVCECARKMEYREKPEMWVHLRVSMMCGSVRVHGPSRPRSLSRDGFVCKHNMSEK